MGRLRSPALNVTLPSQDTIERCGIVLHADAGPPYSLLE